MDITISKLWKLTAVAMISAGAALTGCSSDEPEAAVVVAPGTPTGTCTGTYPSYWQDPAFPAQYAGQQVSNQAPEGWAGPVYPLSDAYPRSPVDDSENQPWRDSKFDALFDPETSQEDKTELATEYAWLVMEYIQAGNVNQEGIEDWNVCNNQIRPWYNIPYQTYDPMSGREFTHGLTREAPVSFSTPEGIIATTMWAVGYFNATAAYTLGTVWQ
ncbi:MAG: hypothetical protein VW274_11645, partial [Thalassolituus sp.]